MRIALMGLMICLLLDAQQVMDAASDACRLFVTAVMPGLFPYMTLSLMLASRFGRGAPLWLLTLLGWGGGSPAGARLLPLAAGASRRRQRQLAAATATMSPMFLLGTCGRWLGSATAGMALLGSVMAGGWLTGLAAYALCREDGQEASLPERPAGPLTFGAAVEQAARTMLLVCGTMAMLRVFAALAAEALPMLALPLTTLLEVTTGTAAIAAAPWPLAFRTALIAGATGFGGMAIVMQNRAVCPPGLMTLPWQLGLQAVHGAISFLLALGMMQLAG